jgi:hypothetical protein
MKNEVKRKMMLKSRESVYQSHGDRNSHANVN